MGFKSMLSFRNASYALGDLVGLFALGECKSILIFSYLFLESVNKSS
jgi:hypothetical protein